MAHAVQVYQYHTTKSVSDITDRLQNAKKRSSKAGRCRVVRVEEEGDTVMALIEIVVMPDILRYDVTIRPRDRCLIVQGSKVGRKKVNELLAKEIDDKTRLDAISEHALNVRQSLQLFQNITKENDSNFISSLKVEFEPQIGYKYARETYQEIGYKFTENRCASKHRDFSKLCARGINIEMKMRLYQCTSLVPENSKGVTMVITPNCGFRLYTNQGQCLWNEFCFKIVNFL